MAIPFRSRALRFATTTPSECKADYGFLIPSAWFQRGDAKRTPSIVRDVHLSHFVAIPGFRLGLGSIAASARSLAQGTQQMVRNSWTLHLSHFNVIRHIRAHGSAAARADVE
jgi:hypothetical protein